MRRLFRQILIKTKGLILDDNVLVVYQDLMMYFRSGGTNDFLSLVENITSFSDLLTIREM